MRYVDVDVVALAGHYAICRSLMNLFWATVRWPIAGVSTRTRSSNCLRISIQVQIMDTIIIIITIIIGVFGRHSGNRGRRAMTTTIIATAQVATATPATSATSVPATRCIASNSTDVANTKSWHDWRYQRQRFHSRWMWMWMWIWIGSSIWRWTHLCRSRMRCAVSESYSPGFSLGGWCTSVFLAFTDHWSLISGCHLKVPKFKWLGTHERLRCGNAGNFYGISCNYSTH